jgi:malate dehydrogenase
MLGTGGVEKVIEIKLTAEEKGAFDKSVDAVKELVAGISL